ncbi:PD-(D/E)XK nuclease family protein [Polyangium sp. y55x31]|uniref:PD-(D/E)XK nuclease family protein n=1 Tax=Polyangium sp. y55x31 TaxID=3042688 RepID=UPI00248275A0|nr:PD-(D/E)XK nuclease family protein [Polyangium sp. y55x31]MDI1476415.1 PD-(D/E)XK nuclease family protein [Polyangium sp. y55x31]
MNKLVPGRADLQKAEVTPEYTLSNGRRVDVRVSMPSLLVFIEVKVDASEGKKQLEDYYAALEHERSGRDGILVYLTLPGHEAPTSPVPYEHITFDQILEAWIPLSDGSDYASQYLARFLKSLALLLE